MRNASIRSWATWDPMHQAWPHGVQFGNTMGGCAKGNQFHRVGYITQTDVDAPLPKYPNPGGAVPVGLDSTGFVRGVTYDGNTFISVNGECIDLDGFREGTVSNNVCIIPSPGDPQFTEDSIGSYGTSGANLTRGVGTGNSNSNGAAKNINFTGNTFINMSASALSLAYAKGCSVRGNRIVHPATAAAVPISLLAAAGTDETACHDNTIEDNSIDYSGVNWCIAEQGTGWTAAHINRVFNNRCTGSNRGEFLRSSGAGGTSSSVVGYQMATNDIAGNWVNSANIVQREGSLDTVSHINTAAWKIYSSTSPLGTIINTQILALADAGPLLNVSANGAANTGAITTGNISAVGILHSVTTQRLFSEAGFLSFHDSGVFDSAADALDAANQAISAWGLIRYNKATGLFEKSTSTNSTANRVWSVLVPAAGGAVAGGTDKMVQYNKANAFFADANLSWDYTAQILSVTTKPVAGAGLIFTDNVAAGGGLAYIYSNGGFFTPSTNAASIHTAGGVTAKDGIFIDTPYNTVQCTLGGMLAKSITAQKYMQVGQYNTVTSGAIAVTPGDVFGGGAIYWELSGTPGLRVFNGTAWLTVGGVGSGVAGTDKMIQYNASNAQAADGNFTWNYTTQQLGVIGKPGTAAITIATAGYILSTEGFNTPSAAGTAISALSGGVSASTGVFSSAATNALQLTAGGMTVALSARVDNAFLSKAQAGIPAYVPPASYGGIAYKGVSSYWYWNGTTWLTIDFTAAVNSSVAGATTQIQYNAAGAFAADAGLTWTKASATFQVSGVSTVPSMNLIGDWSTTSMNVQFNGFSYSGSFSNSGFIFRGFAARGSRAAPSSTLAGDQLLAFGAGGYIGSGFQGNPAAILFIAGSNFSAGNGETYMAFNTVGPAATVSAERMRLASNGVLLVNRTTSDGTGAQLQVNGIVSASSGLVSSLSSFNAISLTGAAGGFNVATGQFRSAAFDSVSCVAAGGMSARSFTATTYVQVGFNPAAPTVTLNDTFHPGALYFDTGLVALRVWSGAAWVNTSPAGAATPPAGSNTNIQYNNGGLFGADANLTWTSGSRLLQINGASLQMAINVQGFGFIQSAEGFVSNSSAGNAVKLPFGGITAVTGSFTSTASFNSIQTTGGVSAGTAAAGGYYVGGTKVIDNTGVFVGSGIIMSAGINIGSSGITCGAVNPSGGFFGLTATVNIASGFTIGGTTFHNLFFQGGVLVNRS